MGRPRTNAQLMVNGTLRYEYIAEIVAQAVGVPSCRLAVGREEIGAELMLTSQGVTYRFGTTNLGETAVSSMDAYHFVNRRTCEVYNGKDPTCSYERIVNSAGGTANLIPVLELPEDGDAAKLLQQHIDATPERRKQIGENGIKGGRPTKVTSGY